MKKRVAKKLQARIAHLEKAIEALTHPATHLITVRLEASHHYMWHNWLESKDLTVIEADHGQLTFKAYTSELGGVSRRACTWCAKVDATLL